MKSNIVLGLGFGDEGKGLTVDYLCSLNPDSLVVRFSGGHQVSHTVVKDNIRHVFSNFGSGTLRDCPTYWSERCTIDPVGLQRELMVLESKGIKPKLYIDNKAMVTTPYDILHNQCEPTLLGNGTCGVGFGATIERNEKRVSLTYQDLFYRDIFTQKLRAIRDYYNPVNPDMVLFLLSCQWLVKNFPPYYGIPGSSNYVFEGSQGLLLDQDYGFFPNVTRSNTGTQNIPPDFKTEKTDIFLVTRAYQTRHGNGFMTNVDIPHNIKDNPNETNVKNEYQGEFRKSLLDVSLIEYAINKDDFVRDSENKNLVITCLDHIVGDYRFTYNGKIIESFSQNQFIKRISDILKIESVYISESDESFYMKKI